MPLSEKGQPNKNTRMADLAQRAQLSGSQNVATLRRENAQLLKLLHDVRLENQSLKSHLYRVSALLDASMAKLESLGVSLVLPQLDIRALNREVKEAAAVWGEMTGETTEESKDQAVQRKFLMQAELKEHTKAVHCGAFAPGDAEVIASGGADRRIVLHNFATGMKLTSIDTAHTAGVTDLVWMSPHLLVSTSADATSKVWDVAAAGGGAGKSASSGGSADPLHVFSVKEGFVLCAAVVDANTYVCSDSRRSTYVVDSRVKRGSQISWDHPARVMSLSCEAGVRLITGSTAGIIAVWDLRMLTQQAPVVTSISGLENCPAVTLPDSPKGSTPTAATREHPGFPVTAPPPCMPSSLLTPILQFENEVSRTPIIHLSTYRGRDDARRLLVVSDDDMIRLYRSASNSGTSGSNSGTNASSIGPGNGFGSGQGASSSSSAVDLSNISSSSNKKQLEYTLSNVLPSVQTRSFNVRATYWQGKQRRQVSQQLFDDTDQRVGDPSKLILRKLHECDLVVSGGGSNFATVFDVTDDGSPVVLQRLEGHKDRVTGATVHHSELRPLVATFSSDTTLRIWAPAKSER